MPILYKTGIEHFPWCCPTGAANPCSKPGDQHGSSSQLPLTSVSHAQPSPLACLPSEALYSGQRSLFGFCFAQSRPPWKAVTCCLNPSPRSSLGQSMHRIPWQGGALKKWHGLFLKEEGEEGRDVAMAVQIQRDFLPHADGWLAWLALSEGWVTEHLTLFSFFSHSHF